MRCARGPTAASGPWRLELLPEAFGESSVLAPSARVVVRQVLSARLALRNQRRSGQGPESV